MARFGLCQRQLARFGPCQRQLAGRGSLDAGLDLGQVLPKPLWSAPRRPGPLSPKSALPDGHLMYMVFVNPEQEAQQYSRVLNSMLQSLDVNDSSHAH